MEDMRSELALGALGKRWKSAVSASSALLQRSSSAFSNLPRHLTRPRAVVGDARENEQQVREAVEISDDDRRYVDLAAEREDAALRTPADRARGVERRCRGRPAG